MNKFVTSLLAVSMLFSANAYACDKHDWDVMIEAGAEDDCPMSVWSEGERYDLREVVGHDLGVECQYVLHG